MAGGELGAAYVGAQGDEWDAQKDMALATLGTFVGVVIGLIVRTAATSRRTRQSDPSELCAIAGVREPNVRG